MTPTEASSADSLLQSIARNPADVQAYCKLAAAYESSAEFKKAELSLRRAVEVDPLHHQAWLSLGVLYNNLGKYIQSVDAFERAYALKPEDTSSSIGYCKALMTTQNVQSAASLAASLVEKFPDLSQSHLVEGHIKKIQGRFGEAAHSYRRALQVDSEGSEALFNLVDLDPPTPSDPLTLQLEKIQRNPATSLSRLANVSFALARIYETANQVDRAFAFYYDGNVATRAEMQRLGMCYNHRRVENDAAEIMDMFCRPVSANRLEGPDPEVRLIFIVGMPRSGTTLVQQILSNHSHVCAAGELPFMQQYLSKLLDTRRSLSKTGPIRSADEEDQRVLLELRQEYVDRLFERDLDDDYVIDKLPANFAALGLIRMLFPNAIFIHCTRHPVATCWSSYSSHFGVHLTYKTSFQDLADYYNVYRRLMAHWDEMFGTDILNVSYERLVLDPETNIREMVKFCGLPWENDCLNFHANTQPVYTGSMQQVRRPIYATSVSRWCKYKKLIGPLIERLDHPVLDVRT